MGGFGPYDELLYMQQATLINAPSPITGMAALAKSIAMPHEYVPQRFPSFPALERTATMGFNFNALLPVGITRALLMRDPVYPFWSEVSSNNNVWGVVARLRNQSISETSGAVLSQEFTEFTFPNQLETVCMGTQVGTVASTSTTIVVEGSAVEPSTGLPVVGYDLYSDRPNFGYIYVPDGFLFSILHVFASSPVSGAGAVANIEYTVEKWVGRGKSTIVPGVTVLGSIATGASHAEVFNLTLGGSGWYRVVAATVRLVVPASITGGFTGMINEMYCYASAGNASYTSATKTLTFAAGTKTTLMPLAFSKEFLTSVAPWQDTKVTAVSVLATNVTKVLNKEGTVLAGRITPRTGPVWGFISNQLETLHPAEKSYMGLEQGFYTYCPPAGDMVEFTSHLLVLNNPYPVQTPTGGSMSTLPVFALHNTSFANAMIFQDPDAGTNLALNVDWHIEFRNNSVLFPIGMSTITLEQYHQAQIALAAMGFFFGNETHVERIKRLAKSIAGWAGKLAPAVSLVSPLVGKGMAVASDLMLGSRPPDAVQPTNLQLKPPVRSASVDSRSSGTSIKRKSALAVRPALSKAARKKQRQKAKIQG